MVSAKGRLDKANIDGASKGTNSRSAAGGVLRDHHRAWLTGFQRSVGCCSALNAEL